MENINQIIIYQLKETIENCNYGKFNHIVDENYINCDLGIYDEQNGEQIFVIKYASAVIEKTKLEGYNE